jgi:hypothetical protein
MFPSKRIIAILGLIVGSTNLLTGSELVFNRRGQPWTPQRSFQEQIGPSRAPQSLRWNWHESQELYAAQSLRNAKITGQGRQAIAAAIMVQLRPVVSDLEIDSDEQLNKVALDTRIKLVDLNHDGIPEVVAQGMVNCSPTGNCPFWVFQKTPKGYKLLVEGYGQTFTIQKTSTHGFKDIVLSMHGSATQSGLTDYRYEDGSYHDVGCYSASWTVLEGETVQHLKEPLITPCDHQ